MVKLRTGRDQPHPKTPLPKLALTKGGKVAHERPNRSIAYASPIQKKKKKYRVHRYGDPAARPKGK